VLKSQARNQDILIDFGAELFEKLEKINTTLSQIANAIQDYAGGDTNGQEQEEQTAYEN